MLYTKLLNILPTFLLFALWAILIAYFIYLVYSTRKGVDHFTSVKNFSPIALILFLHFIEKSIYFLFSIRLENIENNLFILCFYIIILCFLGQKYGPLGVVAPICLTLGIPFFFHFFKIFTALVLAIISIVVIFKKVKKCKEDFTDYLFWLLVILAWLLFQVFFGMMNAFEIVLFALSLWYSIKDIGVKGVLQWCIHVIIGLLMFYIIDWSFLHIITVTVLYWVLFCWIPQIL